MATDALKLKEISYIHAEADSAVDAEEGVHILRLPEHLALRSLSRFVASA